VVELKLGSIPLRIQGRFFIMALLLGLNEREPSRLAIWVAIVLVSVIVHELGHALMGKAFGLTPSIELQGMGGLTSFNGGRAELSTLKSIAISVAGPFAGFAFASLFLIAWLAGVRPAHPLAHHAGWLLFVVNGIWGVFNLLPMLPLDGGNVLRSITRALTKDHGEKAARVISVITAATVAVVFIRLGWWWGLYLCVLFAFQNVQVLRQAGQMRVDQALADAIHAGHEALMRKAPQEAIAVLQPALAAEASSDLRQVALRVYVAALLHNGDADEAMRVIERERTIIGSEDLAHHARAMRALGRTSEADRIDELVKAPAPLSEFRAS
jgi:Zn-dependent protease